MIMKGILCVMHPADNIMKDLACTKTGDLVFCYIPGSKNIHSLTILENDLNSQVLSLF